MAADNDQLKPGQEGTTGNNRGEVSSKNDTDATLQGAENATPGTGGQGGSTLNSQLEGSNDHGERGSLAEGVEGSGGDSVTGVKKSVDNQK